MIICYIIAMIALIVSFILAVFNDDDDTSSIIFICVMIAILFLMLGNEKYYNTKLNKALINNKAIEAKIIDNKLKFVLIDSTYIDFWEIRKGN